MFSTGSDSEQVKSLIFRRQHPKEGGSGTAAPCVAGGSRGSRSAGCAENISSSTVCRRTFRPAASSNLNDVECAVVIANGMGCLPERATVRPRPENPIIRVALRQSRFLREISGGQRPGGRRFTPDQTGLTDKVTRFRDSGLQGGKQMKMTGAEIFGQVPAGRKRSNTLFSWRGRAAHLMTGCSSGKRSSTFSSATSRPPFMPPTATRARRRRSALVTSGPSATNAVTGIATAYGFDSHRRHFRPGGADAGDRS